jgi:hypothetical protein
VLAAGLGAPQLADPGVACAQWALPVVEQGEALGRLLSWLGPPPQDPQAAVQEAAAHEVLETGRALALACASAVRRLPRAEAADLRERVRRDLLGAGLPRLLLPMLGRKALQLGPAVAERGRSYAVHLEDGGVASGGRTLIQARVRALALRAQAGRSLLPTGNVLQDLIEARLGRTVLRPTLFLIAEHAAVAGPPFDPLNRGPERAIGMRSATAVHLHPDRRPSAWRLRPADALRRLVVDALAGLDVEVVPYSPEAQPVAARLARLAEFVGQAHPAPPAVAAGGLVLVAAGGHLRRQPLGRFAQRPTSCTPDPEAFDLALAPERGTRFQTNLVQRGVLESRTFQISDELGCVLTRDDAGRLLREEVPLDRIEDHLRESRDLLRLCTPVATLAARLSDQLETVLLVHRRQLPRLPIQIGGRLPFALWVEVEGERIGLGHAGGWPALTQALMSRIPFGGEFRIGVDRVSVLVGGKPAAPILQLYARSLVLRRLGARLHRELAPPPEPPLIEL